MSKQKNTKPHKKVEKDEFSKYNKEVTAVFIGILIAVPLVLFVNERQKNNSLIKQSLENKSSVSNTIDCGSDIYKKQEGKIAVSLPEECKIKEPEPTVQSEESQTSNPQPNSTTQKSAEDKAYERVVNDLNSIPTPTVPQCYEPLKQVAIDKKNSDLNYENNLFNSTYDPGPNYPSSWYANRMYQEKLRHESRLVEIEQQYLRDLAEANCTP